MMKIQRQEDEFATTETDFVEFANTKPDFRDFANTEPVFANRETDLKI